MSGKTYLRNQNFFKRNYFEAVKYILPGYLYEDDVSGTPKAEDPIDTVINSHIDVAANFSSILNVSAVPGTVYSSINTLQGIAPYFVKQNKLTEITSKRFQDKILDYFDKKLTEFSTADEFKSYVETTLIPALQLNNPDTSVFSTLGSASAIHNYLITNLSWMYFLNTSGDSYDPSSYVRDLLVSSTFKGKPVKTNDGINGLSEHLWKNASGSYYPSALFASGSRSDLSGTQQLDKFKTWNDVIYSPLFSDSSDFRVRDKFDTYIDNSLKSSNKIESGPFARLIRALSFFAYDISNETEEISTLYDIDDCPDDYLPLIAQLIGWDLFGDNPERWRLQLRNAVAIYKAVGTKRSIQSTINTVFPKNQFPIENRLTELWESYVPYLLYYSLATESSLFKSYDTWTPDLAAQMNVDTYSTSSMDDNIRLAVDRIILETIRQFPDKFPINSWLSEFDAAFNYRGRDFVIPPFEEYPYYVNTELDADMVTFLTDRLACFGVRKEFALDVSSYIQTNALNSDDEPKGSSWLIFTSGYNAPPNLDNLIRNLNDNRFDYASLWSGKSSHFKLVLQTSEFDFNDKDLNNINSGDSLDFIAQSVNNFSPAHAIPLITLEVSAPPDNLGFESSCLPHVYIDREEINAGAGDNTFASGIFLNTYKRGINPDGNVIGKSATQSLVSPELLNVSSIGNVSRNTARRRSFEKVMPFNGYYDRTGFNMPVSFNMASGLSGIPLGLVPSSLTYAPVNDVIDPSGVWAQCEGLNSNNSYYEYDVSNTQNIRGIDGSMQANTDRTTDRGQLPGIYAAMHRMGEGRKYFQALLDVGTSTSTLESYLEVLEYVIQFSGGADLVFLNNEIIRVKALLNGDYRSLATSGSNAGAEGYTFPNSVNDFYYFEFGRDLHRLYKIYTENFERHRLSPDIQKQDGANVFSHTYGPLLYNHSFEKIKESDALISKSFENPTKITASLPAFNSFVASSNDSMYLDTFEKVSSSLVNAVELVLTSGTDADSSFSLMRIPSSQKASFDDPFLYDKTLLLMRSGRAAATRIRFDISKYAADVLHPISNNFLIPEHDYKVSLDSLISRDDGSTFGGRSVGVWIHTKPEGGSMWSFTPDGVWEQHSQLISRQNMLSKYSHRKRLESKSKTPQTSNSTTETNYACLDQITSEERSPVIGIHEDDFENFTVKFNTRNKSIKLSRAYQKEYNQIHRLNQNYVIEVFMAPGAQPDEFMLIDKVEVQNLTMKKLSEIFAAGTLSDPLCVVDFKGKECLEYRIDTSKEDLFEIFKHFNNIAGKNALSGYASRDKAKTATIMESEGGSRIDYRLPNELITPTLAGTGNYYAQVTIPI